MRHPLPRAILLAGGASRRFGSDKATAPFRGTTLVAYQVEQLLGLFARVLVVAKDPERLALPPDPRVRLVKETHPDQAALVGLVTGLHASDRQLSYVVGVDMPGIVPALIHRLYAEARRHDAALRMDESGRLQPLGGFYSTRALPVLERRLAAGQFRLMELLEELDVAVLPFHETRALDPEGRSFWNVNMVEDLRALGEAANGGPR